ncbi:MAG: hypothetical protein ABW252_06740 [Polyangiales bacterium]
MSRRDRVREFALCAWVLAMLSFSWMYAEISVPNERTRAYLTAALVDDHTLHIDGPIQRYGAVYDLAQHDGHFYTDKAPGSSLFAAPVYWVARKLSSETAPFDAARIVNLVRNWLMIPCGVLGFALLRALLRRLGRSARTVGLVSIAYALGCAVFHYSTAFYGHVLVSTLLLAALWALAAAGVLTVDDARTPSRAARLGYVALAGLCAGLAGLTEYQATFIAVLLALPVLLHARDRALTTLAYAAGGLPAALALLAYNKAAFGGVLELSYQHLVGEALQQIHAGGVAGATLPSRTAVEGLLFSAHRGLLVTSPWLGLGALSLLFGMPGAVRGLWLSIALSVAYLFVAVSSSSVWHGSWAFGPRLLIPAMPLLAVACAYLLDWGKRVWPLDVFARALVLFAVFYQVLVQVTFAEPPPEVLLPLRQTVEPTLLVGAVAPNLLCKVMPIGLSNLAPIALSLLGLALYVAAPAMHPLPKRLARAALVLAVAGLLGMALWRAEPEDDKPEARLGWGLWMYSLLAVETTCKEPYRPPPAPPAPPPPAPPPEPAPPPPAPPPEPAPAPTPAPAPSPSGNAPTPQ